jgi:hypothetical protein
LPFFFNRKGNKAQGDPAGEGHCGEGPRALTLRNGDKAWDRREDETSHDRVSGADLAAGRGRGWPLMVEEV